MTKGRAKCHMAFGPSLCHESRPKHLNGGAQKGPRKAGPRNHREDPKCAR